MSEIKSTGIVRRIDDLGRIVIPKEVRRSLRWKDGDPIEIHVDGKGRVVLDKYAPMRLDRIGEDYIKSLHEALGCKIALFDTDQCVSSAGFPRGTVMGGPNRKAVKQCMEQRNVVYLLGGSDEGMLYSPPILATPIISEGSVIGALAMYEVDGCAVDRAMLNTAALFIARQYTI